jgi:N-acetylglutamate synthase-like GNAT family acetyltransferase
VWCAVRIRPATEADQQTIRQMVRQAGINPMNLRWPNFLIAEQAGATVGIGQVKPHRDGTRELASMVVVPERRGQGVGGAIIERLIADHAGQVLHLTCRSQLGGYYERFGFVAVGKDDYSPYFRRLIPIANFFGRFVNDRIVVMRRDA